MTILNHFCQASFIEGRGSASVGMYSRYGIRSFFVRLFFFLRRSFLKGSLQQ